jgi:hypothetical protein
MEEAARLHRRGDPGMERRSPSPLCTGTIRGDRQAGPAQRLGHLLATPGGAGAPNRRRSPRTPGTAATWGVGGSKRRGAGAALLQRRPRAATHPWSLSARTVASGATAGVPPPLSQGGPRSACVPLPPQPRGPPRLLQGHDNTRSLSKARQAADSRSRPNTRPTCQRRCAASGAIPRAARSPPLAQRQRCSTLRPRNAGSARKGAVFHFPDKGARSYPQF